jgi:hypothetical protein
MTAPKQFCLWLATRPCWSRRGEKDDSDGSIILADLHSQRIGGKRIWPVFTRSRH